VNDRPTAAELIAAARHFLETELLPTLADARLRFQTLVAANVLSIAEREFQTEEEQLLEEWHWLASQLHEDGEPPPRLAALRQSVRDLNRRLCHEIGTGAYDEPAAFTEVAAHLRQFVERKLAVANPRYLAGFSRKDS
jgi:hypothetical protein